jgi:hypothetical protein
MHILLGRKLFVKVESAGHLEDMLPAMILCFSGFIEGYEGAVGAGCQSGAEGWSVGQRMVRDGPSVALLFPDEHQHFIVCIHLCPFWDRIMILCLLPPMMGQQEAHLQIRYVLAVWDFDEVHPSFVIFNMKFELACALDV